MKEEFQEFVDKHHPSPKCQLLDESRTHLQIAAKWAKFLAILGFIGVGFLVLFAIIVGFAFSLSRYIPIPGILISFIYLAIAVVNFFPMLYLFNFSNSALNALHSGKDMELNQAIVNLKAYFRFNGILSIIGIALFFLALIIALSVAVFSSIM